MFQPSRDGSAVVDRSAVLEVRIVVVLDHQFIIGHFRLQAGDDLKQLLRELLPGIPLLLPLVVGAFLC